MEHDLTLRIDLALADPLATDELAFRQYNGHFLPSMLSPESMNLSFLCCVPLCSIWSGECLSKRSRVPVHRSDSKYECSFGCEEGDACIWAMMIVSLLQTSAATSRDGTRVWVPRGWVGPPRTRYCWTVLPLRLLKKLPGGLVPFPIT